MKSLKSKRWLGIPVIAIISTILVIIVLCATTGVLVAQWAFSSQLSSSVTVSGSGIVLFKDLACTTAYAYPNDTLPSFGTINTDIGDAPFSSGTITIWLKNTGTTNLSPVISTNLSTSGLALNEVTAGNLSSVPVSLLSVASATLTSGFTGYGSPTVPSQYTFTVSSPISGTIPTSGYAIIGLGTPTQETIRYTGYDGTTITGIYDITTSTTHLAGDSIIFSGSNPSPILAPNQVHTITLKIVDNGNVTLGSNPHFNITIVSGAGS